MTYRKIPEFDNYSINEDGIIFSHYTNKERKSYKSGSYLVTKLRRDGISYTTTIHRILARTFLDLDSFSSDKEVDHIDGNTLNHVLSNLQVLTVEEHKLKTYGERKFPKKYCTVCNKELPNPRSLSNLCEAHRQITILLEDIEYWVINYSWVRAAKELGMTDSGLRKRYFNMTGLNPSLLKRSKHERSTP